MLTKTRKHITSSRGFSLMESVVTIGILSILLSTFGTVFLSLRAARTTMWYRQASFFLQEGLESLHSVPFSTLTTRTNSANLLGIAINRGSWQTVAHSTAPSAPNAMKLSAAQTTINGETGIVFLPGNYRANYTYTATVMADSTSPSGWDTALVFGYHDRENYYRLRYNTNGIAVDETTNGTTTTLWSQSVSHTTNTWYTFSIVADDGAYTISKNGSNLTTVNDSTIAQGDLGIMSIDGAIVFADNITVTEGSTTMWDFDATTLGTLPSDWSRLSYLDLPGGTATLSLSDFQNDSELKLATITISWTEGSNTHSVNGSTVIRNH